MWKREELKMPPRFLAQVTAWLLGDIHKTKPYRKSSFLSKIINFKFWILSREVDKSILAEQRDLSRMDSLPYWGLEEVTRESIKNVKRTEGQGT